MLLPFLASLVLTASVEYSTAPVYTRSGAFLQRTGTLKYKTVEEYAVIYCISDAPGKELLQCVVRTDKDQLVLVDIRATELKL